MYHFMEATASIEELIKNTTEVRKGVKIRDRYNQVAHLTQDTDGKVTNSQKTPQTRAKRSALSQQVTTKHIYTEALKDIANTRQNKNIKDPQKKYHLGTVRKGAKTTGGLNICYTLNLCLRYCVFYSLIPFKTF